MRLTTHAPLSRYAPPTQRVGDFADTLERLKTCLQDSPLTQQALAILDQAFLNAKERLSRANDRYSLDEAMTHLQQVCDTMQAFKSGSIEADKVIENAWGLKGQMLYPTHPPKQ